MKIRFSMSWKMVVYGFDSFGECFTLLTSTLQLMLTTLQILLLGLKKNLS